MCHFADISCIDELQTFYIYFINIRQQLLESSC